MRGPNSHPLPGSRTATRDRKNGARAAIPNKATGELIGVGINVPVRCFEQDDVVQPRLATDFVESSAPEALGSISRVILVEAVRR
ncbi:hypothetical protein LO749_21780 (plasmid) [Paracoccus denitrificans]|uniref:hypothetical protein n=1 Tax=Paracoccus denitrificans TaxID=266 RepID=UPI001E61D671|nr:hypothetical protein [Paracoccus denitrificans]UFS68266.1 hypothetical protein LO749_21780 [Paracoccus denitrificans]